LLRDAVSVGALALTSAGEESPAEGVPRLQARVKMNSTQNADALMFDSLFVVHRASRSALNWR